MHEFLNMYIFRTRVSAWYHDIFTMLIINYHLFSNKAIDYCLLVFSKYEKFQSLTLPYNRNLLIATYFGENTSYNEDSVNAY